MVDRAVVIGKSDVIRLCTARAIGSAGYNVDIVRIGYKGKKIKAPDFFSKYVDNYYYFDEAGSVSLFQFLIEKYKECDTKPILFTLDDYTTHIIDDNRVALKDCFLFAHLLNGRSISDLMDKHYIKVKAKSVGLSSVEGWPIIYDKGEFLVPDDIKFPCFVKGLYSFWYSKIIQKKCNNLAELALLVESCKKVYPHSLYAEEYIEIEREMGIIGLCDGNRCIIPAETELCFMGEGASHGVSILGCVKPIEERNEIKDRIANLMRELGYVGIFNIDLIKTKNSVLFVELNLRFATYGYGVFKAGVNLPAIFIDLMNNSVDFDLKLELDRELYYLNEEVAYSNIVEKRLTLKKYNELLKRADILFVDNEEDPHPKCHLRIQFVIKYVYNMIKRVLRY